MMYLDGKGRLEAVSELVKRRNRERNERLGAFRRSLLPLFIGICEAIGR